MKTNSPASDDEPASPIDSLRQILADAGEDIETIFGPAISAYAGPFAANQSPKDKYAALERLILNHKG